MCPGPDSNRHVLRREILSLLCIPFHHLGDGSHSNAHSEISQWALLFEAHAEILAIAADSFQS